MEYNKYQIPKFALLIFFSLISSLGKGQFDCGTDQLNDLKMYETSYRTHLEETESMILNRVILNSSRSSLQDSVCTIPIVVHEIHNGFSSLDEEEVLQAIQFLNDAFSNSGEFSHPEGVSVPIEFCLAKQDPNGAYHPGITQTESALTNMFTPNDDLALKNLIQWDTQRYLNIWVVTTVTGFPNSPGVLGYATLPTSHGSEDDGIVLEEFYFAGSMENSAVLTHEVGHYLGLYHTFQFGCPNDDCMMSGDRVCDTPPDEALYNDACLDGTNSCDTDDDDLSTNNPFRPIATGGLGDQIDDQINYMDYSALSCMQRFSNGQSNRMVAALMSVRSSLLDNPLVCEPPCTTPINLSVSAGDLSIEVGESVDFGNSSTGQTTNSWYVNDSLYSQAESFNFSPAVQGDYLVTLLLENDEPGCFQEETFLVEVICPVSVQIESIDTYADVGGSLSFTSTVTGSQSLAWFVDGVEVSSGSSLTHQFNDQGLSEVVLVASSEFCSVESNQINILVGVCFSGNENNVWHFTAFPDVGAFAMDFNEPLDDPEYIETGDFSFEVHSSICDVTGELLFFSNGENVRDKNYDVLINGDSIMGHHSSHQGAVFLQSGYDSNEYILFTTDGTENDYANGLRYTRIDASANNGLGAVAEDKNVLIYDGQDFEGVEIVDHCNGLDKWLIITTKSTNQIVSILWGAEGPVGTPVVSQFSEESNLGRSLATFSPTGAWMASSQYLYGFDNQTGLFEEKVNFGIITGYSSEEQVNRLSAEFSFNEEVLYLVYLLGQSSSQTCHLAQYDLTLADELIPLSRESILETNNTAEFILDLKRATDERIYGITVDDILRRVNNPEVLGVGCDYVGLPEVSMPDIMFNFMDNSYVGYSTGKTFFIQGESTVCIGSTSEININLACFPYPIEWEFSGVGEFSLGAAGEVVAEFNDAGHSTIIASAVTNCGVVSDTLEIETINPLLFNIGPDIGFCPGDEFIEIELMPGFDQYYWSTGDVGQSAVVSILEETISVVATVAGCHQSDTLSIIGEISGIDLGPDQDICDGEIVILDAGVGYSDYLWQDGAAGQVHTAFLGGTHHVTATQPCFSTDTIYIEDCGQALGLQENGGSIDWDIFPNPSDGLLSIRIATDLGDLPEIEMYDVRGSLILSANQQSVDSKGVFEINLSEFDNGVYTVVLKMETTTDMKRLVLARRQGD